MFFYDVAITESHKIIVAFEGTYEPRHGLINEINTLLEAQASLDLDHRGRTTIESAKLIEDISLFDKDDRVFLKSSRGNVIDTNLGSLMAYLEAIERRDARIAAQGGKEYGPQG